MIVPTARLWWLAAAGILLPVLSLFLPGLDAALLPYNLLLAFLLLATGFWRKKTLGVALTRTFDPVMSVRVGNTVTLHVTNEGAELSGMLRDEPPLGFDVSRQEFEIKLLPEQERDIKYTATPRNRGSGFFRGTFLRALAPLGLCWVQIRLPSEQPVRVYPNVHAIKEFELLKQKGRLSLMGIRKSRLKGIGTEFESLREYNDDDFRRIDWKTTARRGKLVVRDYEHEKNQAVIVCLDVGRHMLSEVNGVRKLDHALDACLMLIHAAAASGDQVGLLVYGDTVKRYVPPRKGRNQKGVILDAVHSLNAEPVEPNAAAAFGYLSTRWKRRSLLVVFSDAENEDQAAELVRALSPLARRHLIMVVRVSDPRLKELVSMSISTSGDLYKRAASLWYGSDRRRAESKLTARGIHSIDSEPQDLAAALVSAYLRVKETSAL